MPPLTQATSADKVPGSSTGYRRYRKAALAAAIAWTALIFVACLWPGKELPHSDIPFIDKWTHFVLFGVFSALWLCAYPAAKNTGRLVLITVIATVLGIAVEGLQLWLSQLGRSGDVMDAAADAVGGALGAAGFGIAARRRRGTRHIHGLP